MCVYLKSYLSPIVKFTHHFMISVIMSQTMPSIGTMTMRGTPIRGRRMNTPARQAVIRQVDCPGDTLESMDPPAAAYQSKAGILI